MKRPAGTIPNAARRRWKNRLAMAIMTTMVMLCLIPLVSVLYKLLVMGIPTLSVRLITGLPLNTPKGIGNAIAGSACILLLATLLCVPLGMLCGLYLSQCPETRIAKLARLLLDAMAGIPGIVVGMFVYTMLVLPMGGASLLAGAMSLAIIMLPVFARTAEEALKAIPHTVTEAGLGLGLPRRTVILRVLVRSAMPPILTGLFLAIARVGGEAAPLLFTALDSNHWPRLGPGVLTEQIASLPVTIYELARKPFREDYELAWGASLVLVVCIVMIRLSTNIYVRWRYGSGGVSH